MASRRRNARWRSAIVEGPARPPRVEDFGNVPSPAADTPCTPSAPPLRQYPPSPTCIKTVSTAPRSPRRPWSHEIIASRAHAQRARSARVNSLQASAKLGSPFTTHTYHKLVAVTGEREPSMPSGHVHRVVGSSARRDLESLVAAGFETSRYHQRVAPIATLHAAFGVLQTLGSILRRQWRVSARRARALRPLGRDSARHCRATHPCRDLAQIDCTAFNVKRLAMMRSRHRDTSLLEPQTVRPRPPTAGNRLAGAARPAHRYSPRENARYQSTSTARAATWVDQFPPVTSVTFDQTTNAVFLRNDTVSTTITSCWERPGCSVSAPPCRSRQVTIVLAFELGRFARLQRGNWFAPADADQPSFRARGSVVAISISTLTTGISS